MPPIDALASVSYDRSLVGPGCVRGFCTSNPRPLSPSARPGLATLNKGICTFLARLSTVLLFGLLYAWLFRLGTREARSHATGKETRASLHWPVLFTPVSFYSMVGVWGGYYANWLALILVY